MLDATNETPQSGMRTYVLISTVVFILALGYVGWVFWSRAHQDKMIEQRAAEQRQAQEKSQDAQAVTAMGGNNFEILEFYASPGVVNAGDDTQLCYGVSNARTVTLEPQSNAVWPSYERCVSVTPKKTTTYTLTATSATGETKTSTLTVTVQ
jgi:hypothetical protein